MSTFAYDSKNLNEREPITKELYKQYRIKIKLNNEIHYVGVISLTNTTATINVSSTSQQAMFNIGEEKKFEISGDNFYDVLVKLNGIKNNKANVSISYVHEQIQQPVPPPANNTGAAPPANNTGTTPPPATNNGSGSGKKSIGIWTIVIIIVLAVVVVLAIAYYFYFRKQNHKYYHNTHSFYA